jgi:hypothetical protein
MRKDFMDKETQLKQMGVIFRRQLPKGSTEIPKTLAGFEVLAAKVTKT